MKSGLFLSFHPARDDKLPDFLELMKSEACAYLEESLRLLGLSLDDFDRLFRRVGEVRGIYSGDDLAGFCWIEQRDDTLHLHGLIIRAEQQGQGIGSWALDALATEYRGLVDWIELGVHRSNQAAIRLYTRNGFGTQLVLEELGDLLMRNSLKQEVEWGMPGEDRRGNHADSGD